MPRVLVVEDDPAIRALLVSALQRAGLDVDVANDGVAALERMESSEYAVLLVDLMMPRMSGFDFIEALPALPLRVKPVVFVMSAFDDAAFRQLDPTLVHGCVRKPFDVEQVVEVVRDCANLLHDGHPLAGGAAGDRRPNVH
ncbi:MAG: response regulator [Acidobacteria bacterium]|nr:response regulator [Acidobacteriota bacterium]